MSQRRMDTRVWLDPVENNMSDNEVGHHRHNGKTETWPTPVLRMLNLLSPTLLGSSPDMDRVMIATTDKPCRRWNKYHWQNWCWWWTGLIRNMIMAALSINFWFNGRIHCKRIECMGMREHYYYQQAQNVFLKRSNKACSKIVQDNTILRSALK